MTTRNGATAGQQGDFFDLLTAPANDQNAPDPETAPIDSEEIELADLRSRLETALKQVRKGKLAASSGEESLRRAFAATRQKD